ncbi:MAG TPA: hypothetical protein VJX10_17350 [Pseudonocardiaceae bacterium]|nr:hypothetical protein [Pseudonocardiaceae bacterium]
MSWQDELHQLDTALAAGRISADEYRQKRDQLLALAAGEQAGGAPAPDAGQQGAPGATPPGPQPSQQVQPAPQAQPSQHAQPPAQGGPQEQQRTPFPEAFRWTPTGTPSRGTDMTQAMRPVSGPQQNTGGDDRTQVVPGRDVDRTQVVQRPGQPAGGWPPAPGQPWRVVPPQGQQDEGYSPPWGVDPSQELGGVPSWIRQGPEVFAENKGRGRKIAIIIAVVVVLLGGGVTAFLVASNSGRHAQAGGAQITTTTSTKPKPPPGPKLPPGPFIPLQGKQLVNMTWSINDAVAAKVPTQQEAALLQQNGIDTVSALITDNDGVHDGIWAFTPANGDDGSGALTAMDNYYTHAGYRPIPGAPPGVEALSLAGTSTVSATYRAHYLTRDGVFVRIEVYGRTPDVDQTLLEQQFNDLMSQEVAKYPPSGA